MTLTNLLLRALRYRLDTLVDALAVDTSHLPGVARNLVRLTRLLPTPKSSSGTRLRLFLESLGPVAIKFGQLLSTRPDLLSDELIEELSGLQADVPPFDTRLAVAAIERDLGKPVAQLFDEFEDTPLASASVAQVHRARLGNGHRVAVKVVRPDIRPLIKSQIGLMRRVAELLEKHSDDARRLHLRRVVDDYEHTIHAELDMRQEADNTVQLRLNFAASALLYVPRVYREFSGRDVLTLEYVEGVPIDAVEKLRALGVDMKKLAERGVETFFTQVFVHNFFHADMHPGNILIDVSDPSEPSYIALDCAIIGSLPQVDRTYLARNLIAFFRRDYQQVAHLLLAAGWAPPETDRQAFAAVIRELCEPVFNKPLSQIEFGHFLVSLFRSARQFRLEMQPQLVLLQKTLLYVEGLGRQLYPQLDLWETGKPFMERWMHDHFGPAAQLMAVFDTLPELLSAIPGLPGEVRDLRRDLSRLSAQVTQQRTHRQQARRATRSGQIFARTAGVVLLLASGWLVSPLSELAQTANTMAGIIALAGAYLVVRA